MQGFYFCLPRKTKLTLQVWRNSSGFLPHAAAMPIEEVGAFDISEFGLEHFSHLPIDMCVECNRLFRLVLPVRVDCEKTVVAAADLLILVAEFCYIPKFCKCVSGIIGWHGQMWVGRKCRNRMRLRIWVRCGWRASVNRPLWGSAFHIIVTGWFCARVECLMDRP
jgi:hypothetical protein